MVDKQVMGEGLSPRGRGKLGVSELGPIAIGSIPAWAGETAPPMPGFALAKVYPRVGGGNGAQAIRYRIIQGLSPRGRGKLPIFRLSGLGIRSIPAWAGETRTADGQSILKTVYPRVGGGNLRKIRSGPGRRGLSPRGRGKHLDADAEHQR